MLKLQIIFFLLSHLFVSLVQSSSEKKLDFATTNWSNNVNPFNLKAEKQTVDTRLTNYVPIDEVWVSTGKSAELFCSYSLSSGEDRPVTITWKVGQGPQLASPLLRCSGYTQEKGTCSSIGIYDSDYYARLQLGQLKGVPSLEISPVTSNDNRNFWCEVVVENTDNYEFEYDMKSIGLKLYDVGQLPYKLNHVVVDDYNFVYSTVGSDITLNCRCNDESEFCEDLFWYKGPSSEDQFEQIFSRTYTMHDGIVEEFHNGWDETASISGNSLRLENVKLENSGRYWCEVRAASYRMGIEELSTDAESVVLHVTE